jgi:formate hydrogenlyase subunit 3/multisubunit Na+/H+ antiporter MnhD subunit
MSAGSRCALVALIPRSTALAYGSWRCSLPFHAARHQSVLAVPGRVGWVSPSNRSLPWVDGLGISYHVGADGLNIGLILMGAIVAFAAACVSWEIQDREKEFYLLLLVMTGGILGAFASLDLFFFFSSTNWR